MASSTQIASLTSTSLATSIPTQIALNFQTPALTTTFTPPAECTAGHLTMLQSDAYKVWLNEPRPVPNTTFSSCYPSQFVTSYLHSVSSTVLPAFSPLVCQHNYFTIFNQSISSRPLYVACCPSNYGFAPPSISTPGRPAYGGTCYSNIISTSITQYDNSSSSGVMYFSTSGQAYAHPIDGFALETATSQLTIISTAPNSITPTESLPNQASTNSNNHVSTGHSHRGLIIGLVLGLVLGIAFLLAASLLLFRSRKPKAAIPATEKDPKDPNWMTASDKGNAKELPSPPPKYVTDPMNSLRSELANGHGTEVHEMPNNNDQTATELAGGR